jgi:hypothetical protein
MQTFSRTSNKLQYKYLTTSSNYVTILLKNQKISFLKNTRNVITPKWYNSGWIIISPPLAYINIILIKGRNSIYSVARQQLSVGSLYNTKIIYYYTETTDVKLMPPYGWHVETQRRLDSSPWKTLETMWFLVSRSVSAEKFVSIKAARCRSSNSWKKYNFQITTSIDWLTGIPLKGAKSAQTSLNNTNTSKQV